MNLNELLEGLKQEYIDALPQRITEIKSFYSQLNHKALITEFHKLKGTGKTYGIPEISDLGEVVEGFCQRSPEKSLKAIPTAIHLLEEIYQMRKKSASFDLHNDLRFHQLQEFLKLD